MHPCTLTCKSQWNWGSLPYPEFTQVLLPSGTTFRPSFLMGLVGVRCSKGSKARAK